ncbi:MAG: hypothetical protein ACI4OA_02380 [Selenomonadaceae bacterium]
MRYTKYKKLMASLAIAAVVACPLSFGLCPSVAFASVSEADANADYDELDSNGESVYVDSEARTAKAADTAIATESADAAIDDVDNDFNKNVDVDDDRTDAEREAAKAEREEKRRKKAEEKKAREENKKREQGDTEFEELFRDDSYVYSYDKKNIKWEQIPYRDSKMLNFWVKLTPRETLDVPEDERSSDGAGTTLSTSTDAEHYFLEHYYLRRDTRQIMFLCELEVTGKPNNDVFTGRYDPSKWEDLVPGSIEDLIFHAMIRKINNPKNAVADRHVTDFLEDVFHISI